MDPTADDQCDLSVIQIGWKIEASDICTTAALLCLLARHAENNSRPLSATLEWDDATQPTENNRVVKRLIVPVTTRKESTIKAYLDHISILRRENQQGTISSNEPLDGVPKHDAYSLQVRLVAGNHDSKEPNQKNFAMMPHFLLQVRNECARLKTSYNGNFLDHRLMHHLSWQFEHITQQFSTLPTTATISQLSFCTPFDCDRIMEWNSRPPPCVEDVITARFDMQVRCQPTAPAICSWDGNYTYQELHELSYRLALKLQNHMSDGQIVLLCFDKSAAAIISMIAVLRAGGACASTSPAQPIERQRATFDKCDAKVVLCSPNWVNRMREVVGENCTVLAIDAEGLAALPAATPESIAQLPRLESTSLAYILFTSGTTGTPKAIAVEHGSLCTTAEAHGTKWRMGPGARVLQFSAYSFDVSVADVFFSITQGACICSPSETERLDDLAGAAKRMKANWAYLTCSMAASIRPSSMPFIKFLLVGGEPPTRQMVQSWAESTDLVISTGPAESSIHCMGTEPVSPDSDPMNVGRAIGGRLWVTEPDDPNKLAPFGAVGELVVEGRIVSRGYLGDPEKTTEAFITEPPYLPFPEKWPGATRRLYRSGDLVQYMPDGTMRMIGRKDHQVKIRGQRVELIEVETHLRLATPWAKSVRVVLNKRNGADGLNAFLVADPETLSQLAEKSECENTMTWSDEGTELMTKVENELRQQLPSYMIPQHFIPLDKLPSTVNGKLDLAQLNIIYEAFVQAMGKAGNSELTPIFDPREALMADLWSKVLKVDRKAIGRESDFFRIGGDSLSAIRLVAQAAQSDLNFGYALISRNPKLKDLTALAKSSGFDFVLKLPQPGSLLLNEQSDMASLCEIYAEQCGVDEGIIADIYPCTPMQEGLMSLSLRHPGTYTTRIIWACVPDLDIERFKKSWETVYEANDILRTRMVIDDDVGNLMQVVVKDRLEWQAFPPEADTSREGNPEFDIGEALIRCALRVGSLSRKGVRFMLEMHHAIYDAFCLANILDQVARAYLEKQLPPTVPFKSFVAHRQDMNEQSAAEFWRAQFEGFGVSNYFGGQVNGFDASREFSHYELSLPRSKLPRTMQHTLSTIIMGGYASVLSRHVGADDICFGTTMSGRHASLSSVLEIMGPTLTTFPFRIQTTPKDSRDQILSKVRRKREDIIPFEQYGMQSIRSLSPNAAAACSFDTMLIIQPPKQASLFGQLVSDEEDSSEVVGEFALVVECVLGEENIIFKAEYDKRKMGNGEAQLILDELFNAVVAFAS